MKTTLNMGPVEWLLLLLLACLWGSSFLLMKIAVQELPVLTVVLGRIGIAAVLLTGTVLIRGMALPTSPEVWGQLILLGFLRAALPISLFVWAGTQIDSNISGILNSTTPIFTAIVAHFLTADERLNRQKLAGIGAGMLGVLFLIGPSALSGLGENVWGQLAVCGATLTYGFANVYGRRFKQQPVAVTTASMLVGATILIAPISLWIAPPWTVEASATAIGAVIGLAIFNTAIAFMVWLTIVLRAGATNSAQVTFIIPIVALVLGYFVLGETPGWNALTGLIFILLGLAITQGKPARLSRLFPAKQA